MTKQAKSFMSAATGSFTETIHVRLLDEGVDVWRPVRARALGDGAYELAGDPAPPDESWEFAPGAKVGVKIDKNVAKAVAPPKSAKRRR
ncbi:MAG: hypothetical protein JNJ73_07855 [Hyphomonadaceae bacterium]|nr:hypothetical protein [Hyphomonadaceae bacterium]